MKLKKAFCIQCSKHTDCRVKDCGPYNVTICAKCEKKMWRDEHERMKTIPDNNDDLEF